MRKSPLLRSYAYVTYFLSSVSAFSVTFGPPSQCDPFTVSWTGGQAPFLIQLTPKFSPLVNVSVPLSAFSNGQGSYSIPQLPLTNGMEFLLTMSDALGFNTGGTTTLLTVGPPVANNSCNTKLKQDFYFQLPSALKQCDGYEFTGYDGAIQPLTITGLIPGGMAIPLHPPNGTSYNWTVSIQEGTNLLIFMVDSQGRQGGVSDLLTVAASTDGSCLVVNSPSSTVSASSRPTSTQSTFTPGNHTSNAGVIAGATVGSVVFVILLVILGICCKRKMSRSSNVESYPVRLPHKDDGHEIKGHDQVQQNFTSQHQTGRQHDQSHLANVSPSDPFSQHLRQMSYTDSFAGSSSISTPSRLVGGTGGQTSPHGTFTHQPLPVGLAPPTHPGTHNISANNNVAIRDPHAPFSQMQPSRQVSNLDAMAGYGDAGSPTIYPTSRRMGPFAGQTVSQNYSFPYQTSPTIYLGPSGSMSHQMSTSSSTVVDPPSAPINQTHPPHLESNIERFATVTHVDAGSKSPDVRTAKSADQTTTEHPTQYIVHTDVADVQVAPDTKKVVELPPQYASRDPPVSPVSALHSQP